VYPLVRCRPEAADLSSANMGGLSQTSWTFQTHMASAMAEDMHSQQLGLMHATRGTCLPSHLASWLASLIAVQCAICIEEQGPVMPETPRHSCHNAQHDPALKNPSPSSSPLPTSCLPWAATHMSEPAQSFAIAGGSFRNAFLIREPEVHDQVACRVADTVLFTP